MAVIPNEAIFAVVQTPNAWNGAAIAVGAGDGIEPNPPGAVITPQQQYQENEALRGAAGRLKFDLSTHTPDFGFDHNARYEGAQNRLVAGFFGADAITAILSGTVNVGQTHELTIVDRAAEHFTLAAGMGTVDILEVDHFKVDSITLAWTAGERAVWTFDCLGRRWRNDSVINDAAAITAVTAPADRDHWLSSQLTFRIAPQSESTALASPTDDVCINSFTLTLSRGGEGPETTCDSPYRDEPFAAVPGWTGTLAFTIPRWETSSMQDAHLAGTLMMADLDFVGPDLAPGPPGESKGALINLPQLQINEYELSDEGTYGESITAELTAAEVIVAGMIVDPSPYIEIRSEDALQYVV